ncbi:MAG: Crp/Fnr family transcriptional regulator [Egibacteraceae bacterium]
MLTVLHDSDYWLTIVNVDLFVARGHTPIDKYLILVAGLHKSALVQPIASIARQEGCPWLIWNLTDDSRLAKAAAAAGAQAVLPSAATAHAFVNAIDASIGQQVQTLLQDHSCVTRKLRRGTRIILSEDAVLDVKEGVVASAVLFEDGTEVLLGLFGSGQTVLGRADKHPIEIIAQTDATVALRTWEDAIRQPGFYGHLRERLRKVELWGAIQGQRHLDQRLLGTLSLLAEQFGIQEDKHIRIDIRITHAQLASAIGATRATVTRLLGELRRRGLLQCGGTGNEERFYLLQSPGLRT